jgi:apolipoprotein D and lipocalin family protein
LTPNARRLRPLLLAPFALLILAAAPEPKKPVELQHYAGRWFEVARLHNKLEDDCVRAQADYVPRQDGGFSVIQTCYRANAKPKLYHADMKVLDPGMNAKIRLTFFPFVWKDYWVLDFAPDNSWVVLGEPTGKYLWLFTRKTNLAADRPDLVAHAKALGYDTSKLIYDKAG